MCIRLINWDERVSRFHIKRVRPESSAFDVSVFGFKTAEPPLFFLLGACAKKRRACSDDDVFAIISQKLMGAQPF